MNWRFPPLRRALPFSLVLALLTLGFFWQRTADGPMVVYLIDTLRPDRMSVYGASRETSPSADALAKEGVAFTNAFAVSTWTRPSVATLLTSLLPSEAMTLNRYGRLDESVVTLQGLFQKAGWKTAAFVGNGNVFDKRLGFQRGFDVFEAVTGDNDVWRPTARQVVDPALRFIEAQKSPRFFLYVHVLDPHLPYLLEPRNRGLFAADKTAPLDPEKGLLLEYDRAVRQADEEFGRIAAALRQKGWWNPATIVYTADHGEEFYERGSQGHGRTLYEEQVRVPLIIKYRGRADGGSRRADPVSLGDVTPTLAGLAGLPASPRWIGGNLRKSRFPADRELYMTESLDDVRAYGLRRGMGKIIVELYPKYRRVIYRLDRDPGERNGRELACEFAGDIEKDSLLAPLARWHARDVAAHPAIRYQKVKREALVLDLLVNLDSTPKPFLTAEDYCRFTPLARGNRFELHEALGSNEPFDLGISANDRGNLPLARLEVSTAQGSQPVSLDSRDSPLRITRKEGRFVQGQTSDELLRALRSLGYLGAGQDSDHRP